MYFLCPASGALHLRPPQFFLKCLPLLTLVPDDWAGKVATTAADVIPAGVPMVRLVATGREILLDLIHDTLWQAHSACSPLSIILVHNVHHGQFQLLVDTIGGWGLLEINFGREAAQHIMVLHGHAWLQVAVAAVDDMLRFPQFVNGHSLRHAVTFTISSWDPNLPTNGRLNVNVHFVLSTDLR